MIYQNLSSSCIPIRGFSRSIILDISRNSYVFVPNSLVDVLDVSTELTREELKEKYTEEENLIIDEYFTFLNENEFIYNLPNTNLQKIDLTFDIFNKISNSILEINENNIDLITEKTIEQLNEVNCEYIEIVFFNEIQKTKLFRILNLFEFSTLRSIHINLKFSNEIKDSLLEIRMNYFRVQQVILYSSDKNENYKVGEGVALSIIEIKDSIEINNYCGAVHPNYFSQNLNHLAESQCHNTCLNKKISIDANGDIKNCPSMKKSFGNIKDTTLEEALEKPGFKDLWTIKKDDIEVCKDCEFRHICTDCRAFIKDPENIYSQPAKCPYNPYIAKWEGQEGYITVEEWRKQ